MKYLTTKKPGGTTFHTKKRWTTKPLFGDAGKGQFPLFDALMQIDGVEYVGINGFDITIRAGKAFSQDAVNASADELIAKHDDTRED